MVAGEMLEDTVVDQVPVLAATVFAKGDVIFMDAGDDTWKVAAANSTAKKYAVALDASAATAANKKIRAAVGGHTTVIADGAIGPMNRVKPAPTAGQVVEAAEATDLFNSIVGTYVGHSEGNNRDGVTVTAAANDEVIIIELGLNGGRF